jgi:superfamily II DNA or RNA helicase
MELRLVLHGDGALLEWRAGPEAKFVELKQTHASKFGTRFQQSDLMFTPDSLLLWSAVYKPWSYDSWWDFQYTSTTGRPVLNRLLRMPLAPECVVTPDGQPLARMAEPLQLQLVPPVTTGGDYMLTLVTAAQTPPPRILCTLAGQPTLYLTEAGLFSGPAAEALDTNWCKAIPAPALETPGGLNFLHTTGVPLPASLAARVRLVPVKVTVSCKVKRPYPDSRTENIHVTVAAKMPGQPVEKFTPAGWQPQSDRVTEPPRPSAKGFIETPDRSLQSHFPGVLEPLELKWNNYPGEYTLRLTKKTPEVFVPWLESLPPEIEVKLDPELASLRDAPISGSVSLDIEEAGMDWFDLKVVLNVSDTTLTPEELKLLLNARGGYVRLGEKGWRRLRFDLTPEDDEQLARLGLHSKDFSAEPQRFHTLQLADAAAKKFLSTEHVEKIQRRAGELRTRVTPPLPSAIRAELRPYQTEGFHFLAYLTANRFGGVLADDMGLGKTLQALAWLAWLKDEAVVAAASSAAQDGLRPPGTIPATVVPVDSTGPSGAATPEPSGGTAPVPPPSLVVCPKSVTDNWRAEAERFYPGLRVRIWRGEPAEDLPAARETADLVVLNYAQLRALSPAISRVSWRTVILDEAQCIKNPDSQTAVAARALMAEYRLALTGTPIENRLLDLWSILAFAMPGALGNRAHFLKRFNAQDDPLARRRLAARVRPFLLRRTKAQVATDLPDRIEEDLLCEMEGAQQTLYRAELKRARQILLGLQTHQQLNDERFNILTSLLRLRQICCHPALVDAKLRNAESAKLTAIEELLEPLMEEGHKVLVFSQFVTMLDLLRDLVKERKWAHYYLAGDTENRGDLVREFQAAPGGAVFLISLKAGGFGLNLTAASYVVLFDPWWNPAVENQAIDRTHRIGQTSKVMAYRLVMRDSIEQKIRALQKQKAALADDVLGEERFSQSLTLDDLRFLFAE